MKRCPPISSATHTGLFWVTIVGALLVPHVLIAADTSTRYYIESRGFGVTLSNSGFYENSQEILPFASQSNDALQLKGAITARVSANQNSISAQSAYVALGINTVFNGPGQHVYTTFASSTLSNIPSGSTIYYYVSKNSPIFSAASISFSGSSSGSVDIASVTNGGAVNVARSGSYKLLSSGSVTATTFIGSGSVGYYYNQSRTEYDFFANAQVSLLGPIGSLQSPFILLPRSLPREEPEPADESENVTGCQCLTFNVGQIGLGRDQVLWTSSNPADLIPQAGAVTRSLAFNWTEFELVYDITGPKVTQLLFTSALPSILPDLVLEVAGLEIPVTLGQEIDLTAFNPDGFSKFNLRISGNEDWSVLPDDWFLTGYKFADEGDVRVVTRAVPELGSLVLMSLGFVVLGVRHGVRVNQFRK